MATCLTRYCHPNTGETWTVGTSYQIQWGAKVWNEYNVQGIVDIYLYETFDTRTALYSEPKVPNGDGVYSYTPGIGLFSRNNAWSSNEEVKRTFRFIIKGAGNPPEAGDLGPEFTIIKPSGVMISPTQTPPPDQSRSSQSNSLSFSGTTLVPNPTLVPSSGSRSLSPISPTTSPPIGSGSSSGGKSVPTGSPNPTNSSGNDNSSGGGGGDSNSGGGGSSDQPSNGVGSGRDSNGTRSISNGAIAGIAIGSALFLLILLLLLLWRRRARRLAAERKAHMLPSSMNNGGGSGSDGDGTFNRALTGNSYGRASAMAVAAAMMASSGSQLPSSPSAVISLDEKATSFDSSTPIVLAASQHTQQQSIQMQQIGQQGSQLAGVRRASAGETSQSQQATGLLTSNDAAMIADAYRRGLVKPSWRYSQVDEDDENNSEQNLNLSEGTSTTAWRQALASQRLKLELDMATDTSTSVGPLDETAMPIPAPGSTSTVFGGSGGGISATSSTSAVFSAAAAAAVAANIGRSRRTMTTEKAADAHSRHSSRGSGNEFDNEYDDDKDDETSGIGDALESLIEKRSGRLAPSRPSDPGPTTLQSELRNKHSPRLSSSSTNASNHL